MLSSLLNSECNVYHVHHLGLANTYGQMHKPTVDGATATAPTGLLTKILRPQVWNYGHCHLGLLEAEVELGYFDLI